MRREANERESVVLFEMQEASRGNETNELVAIAQVSHRELEAIPGEQGQRQPSVCRRPRSILHAQSSTQLFLAKSRRFQ